MLRMVKLTAISLLLLLGSAYSQTGKTKLYLDLIAYQPVSAPVPEFRTRANCHLQNVVPGTVGHGLL